MPFSADDPPREPKARADVGIDAANDVGSA